MSALFAGQRASANRPPAIFQGVRWSTEHALEDTLLTLPQDRVGFADQLDDVDG